MGNSVSILDTWTLKEGRAFSLLTELVMLLSILKYDLLQADRVRVSEREECQSASQGPVLECRQAPEATVSISSLTVFGREEKT